MDGKLFVFNGGSFESELNTPVGGQALPPDDPLGLAPCLLPLGGEYDRALVEQPVSMESLQPLTETVLPFARPITRDTPLPPGIDHLVPWGCSPSMRKLAESLGLSSPPLDPETVRWANSKRTSHLLETEFDETPAGARLVTHIEEARSALREVSAQRSTESFLWVFKSFLGAAGRGRSLGRGLDLLPPTVGWLEQTLAQEGTVLFEPWLEVLREFSVQLEIDSGTDSPSERVRLLGTTELLTGADGRYLGNRVGTLRAIPDASRLEQVALAVGERLATEGYAGPVGIDALLHRDPKSGEEKLRPLVEINARFTMGRVALQLLPLLPPSGIGTWLLLDSDRPIPLPSYDPATRCGTLSCSPDPAPPAQRRALFVASEEPGKLLQAERILLT